MWMVCCAQGQRTNVDARAETLLANPPFLTRDDVDSIGTGFLGAKCETKVGESGGLGVWGGV